MNLESMLHEQLSKLKLFSLEPQRVIENVNEFVEVSG